MENCENVEKNAEKESCQLISNGIVQMKHNVSNVNSKMLSSNH